MSAPPSPHAHERPEPPPAAPFYLEHDFLILVIHQRRSRARTLVSGLSALALRFSRDFRDCGDGTHRLRFPNAPERITPKSREYLAPGTRTVTCHRTGTHAESGHKRRRDAVERRAALVAGFLGGIAKAQPLAAGRALRVQALNRSAGQGMHSSLRCGAATREKHRGNERDSAPKGLGSQEKYLLLVGVDIRKTRSCG